MNITNTLFTLLLLISISAVEASDKDKINQILNQFHRDAAEANFDGYFSAYDDRGVFLGTDASERWTVPQFKQFVKPYFDKGRGWLYEPSERNIDLVGNTAWFDELLINSKYGECRGSGVLMKSNGQWKIMQYNLHFPIPNDIAGKMTAEIKAFQQQANVDK